MRRKATWAPPAQRRATHGAFEPGRRSRHRPRFRIIKITFRDHPSRSPGRAFQTSLDAPEHSQLPLKHLFARRGGAPQTPPGPNRRIRRAYSVAHPRTRTALSSIHTATRLRTILCVQTVTHRHLFAMSRKIREVMRAKS